MIVDFALYEHEFMNPILNLNFEISFDFMDIIQSGKRERNHPQNNFSSKIVIYNNSQTKLIPKNSNCAVYRVICQRRKRKYKKKKKQVCQSHLSNNINNTDNNRRFGTSGPPIFHSYILYCGSPNINPRRQQKKKKKKSKER